MKSSSHSKVAYFPVLPDEQALLDVVRRTSLATRRADAVAMLEQLAEAGTTPADLELALSLLVDHQQGDDLDARFDNLEARLIERIDQGLAAAEGRLSQRTHHDPPPPPAPAPSADTQLPPDATLALKADGHLIAASSVRDFFIDLFTWARAKGIFTLDDLPIHSSKSRYLLAASPQHPSGKPYYNAGEVNGAYFECNRSRAETMHLATRFLEQRGVSVKVLIGGKD